VRRTAWIVFTAVILSVWACGAAVAQETGPTMQVEVGFDGYCRSNGWCPVRVVLSNEGADIEGELQAAIRDGLDVYAKRVVLPAHSRKAYFLYLPSDDYSSSSRSLLTVQLVARNKVLSSKQVRMAWIEESDRLYGVASSDPSALNFLSDVAPVGSEAIVAHLDLETLPPDPLGWEGLDALILNDVDTAALAGEPRQALETWVVHGGHLIVGGGAGAARTVAGLADPSAGSGHGLLPVVIGGTRSVDDLWALGEWLGTSVDEGPYAVTEVDLRGGEALIRQEDLVLLSRRSYGAGKVDFLAFDAGLKPFARWEDNARLWEWIVGSVATDPQWLRLTVRDGYSAREAVNAIPGLKHPSTLHILAFMLVYTLLIGPVNYIVLRKLDRRELAWLTIPALVLGFTACAYMTGFQLRGTKAIVHRLAAVYVPEGARTGRVSQVVGIFSPRRAKYDVWVAGAGMRPIPGDYYGGPDGQPLHVFAEAGGSTVNDLRVDVGGIQPLLVEGYADVPGVEADLQLVGTATTAMQLEGMIQNSGMPLKDAYLVMGDSERSLGDLEAGQAVSVSLVMGQILPAFSDLPDRLMGSGNYWDDRNLYRRYEFLQAMFPYGESYVMGREAYLVGWAEEEVPLPVEVVGCPFSTIEAAFYVYALPVAALETGVAVTIPPALIQRHVVETTGYVDVWPEGFHMDAEAELVLRFTPWPEMIPAQVDELVLDIQGYASTSMSGSPTVSLWNHENGDWDELGIGWGQHSIPNAGDYVSPSGDVLLRVETGTGWVGEVISLTITIKGRR
jgi:hypothetical protein